MLGSEAQALTVKSFAGIEEFTDHQLLFRDLLANPSTLKKITASDLATCEYCSGCLL